MHHVTIEAELVFIDVAEFGDGKTELAMGAFGAELDGFVEDGGIVFASLADAAREVDEDGPAPRAFVVLNIVERSAHQQIVEAERITID